MSHLHLKHIETLKCTRVQCRHVCALLHVCVRGLVKMLQEPIKGEKNRGGAEEGEARPCMVREGRRELNS